MSKYQSEELFRSTAPYYARHRSGYPPAFFDYLVERFALDGTQRVLDLGCGTGQVALPLSEHVAQVAAVDPEPTMLEEGHKLAAVAGIANITWARGDSCDLHALDLGELDLVIMGASFHWMDRDQVLVDLDQLLAPGGAVVIVSGGAPGTNQPPAWAQTITDIRTRYLGAQRRAGSTTYTHPPERHADVLARSVFSHVETAEWTWCIERDLDDIVGLQFSFSFSAPLLFEGRKDVFEADLRRALTEANPAGVFDERIRTEALIATRP